MKKQILRLSLGMAWCLSALVPVHAPAAGASATADHAARRDTRTAAAQTRPSPADTLHVVFFTDIHVTPGNAQDSLFRVAVAEANASDAELVIFGGDLTNTGSDEELEHVYGLMSQLEKPWFTVMGNHETTWSESGCTTFRCIFGHDGRVAYRAGGYLFLGYNCGPFVFIDKNVVIGDNNKIMANANILYGSRIGNGNTIFPAATDRECHPVETGGVLA